MTKDECLNKAVAPLFPPGEQLSTGTYWRNLKHGELTKRYAGDDDHVPRFGYRVRPDKWGWDRSGSTGLSVNITTCSCAACSILLNPFSNMYEHVVKLDLEALSAELGLSLVASYAPIPGPHDDPSDEGPIAINPCHFNILPTDESIDVALIRLRDFLASEYPKGFPRKPADEALATKALARYSRVFTFERNVGEALRSGSTLG